MKMVVYKLKYYIIFSIAVIFSGCELAGLELQEDVEYEYHVLDPEVDMTAWEFLNLPREDTVFELMLEGVQYAGLEEEYKKPNRTFLFLANEAIVEFDEDDGSVLAGSYFGYNILANGDTATRWEDYPVEEVRDFFLYHIIDSVYSYDNLGPENTEVTTLLDAPDNKAYMKIMNERNSKLRVNDRPFTVKFAEARSSNIQVTNGVVHAFNDFVVPGTVEED
jgi:hypothetical protein